MLINIGQHVFCVIKNSCIVNRHKSIDKLNLDVMICDHTKLNEICSVTESNIHHSVFWGFKEL